MTSLYGAAYPEDRTMKGLFNKKTSQLVLIYRCDKWEHITGRDWSNIKGSVPALPTPDPSLNSISQSLKDIAKCGDDIKDLDDIKKLYFDITGLSAIVQHGINKKDLDTERWLQYCCHSNEYKDIQVYMCADAFTTTKSAFQI